MAEPSRIGTLAWSSSSAIDTSAKESSIHPYHGHLETMTLLVIAYDAVTVRFGLLITRAGASVRPLDNYKLGGLPRNGHQADMTGRIV